MMPPFSWRGQAAANLPKPREEGSSPGRARSSMSFVRPLLSSFAEIIQVRPGQDLPLEGNRASTAGPKVSRESRN